MHLGFGLTGFGRRHALEYDGGVAREVLVVAGTSADRFRELVNVGIDRTDAEHLPLILARHGGVVDKLRVDGANSARVQRITAALRVEHFHGIGREIVRVAKHVLQRLRGRGWGPRHPEPPEPAGRSSARQFGRCERRWHRRRSRVRKCRHPLPRDRYPASRE